MESSDGDAVIWPHCFRTPQDFPCPSPSTAVGCLEVHSAEASGNSSKAILTVNQQQLLEEMWSIWRRQVFLHPQFMLSLHRTAIRGHLWVLTDLFLQCDYNKFKGFQIDTDQVSPKYPSLPIHFPISVQQQHLNFHFLPTVYPLCVPTSQEALMQTCVTNPSPATFHFRCLTKIGAASALIHLRSFQQIQFRAGNISTSQGSNILPFHPKTAQSGYKSCFIGSAYAQAPGLYLTCLKYDVTCTYL